MQDVPEPSLGRASCTRSLAYRKVYQNGASEKKRQLAAAVSFCQSNTVRGYQALKTGEFPLVKSYTTINNILDGRTPPVERSKEYCSAITVAEEQLLVSWIITINRAYQASNRKDFNQFIIKMLMIQDAANKKLREGRSFLPGLSPAARRTLVDRETSHAFIEHFEVKHTSILTKKTQGVTSH